MGVYQHIHTKNIVFAMHSENVTLPDYIIPEWQWESISTTHDHHLSIEETSTVRSKLLKLLIESRKLDQNRLLLSEHYKGEGGKIQNLLEEKFTKSS